MATVNPNIVQDLTDHLLSNAFVSTYPQKTIPSTEGKGKRKTSALLANGESEKPDNDIMELTFQLINATSPFQFIGTRVGPKGETVYIHKKFKKVDKKAKFNNQPTTANAAPYSAVDTTSMTDPTIAPTTDSTIAPMAPTTDSTIALMTDQTIVPTTDPNIDPTIAPKAVPTDLVQYIVDFQNVMFENMKLDNILLQVMFSKFFVILTDVVGNKPMSGKIEGKLQIIQLMANALRAKCDQQSDKEAFMSYLKSQCAAKMYLKKALHNHMQDDNSKSLEDLVDIFLEKAKE